MGMTYQTKMILEEAGIDTSKIPEPVYQAPSVWGPVLLAAVCFGLVGLFTAALLLIGVPPVVLGVIAFAVLALGVR